MYMYVQSVDCIYVGMVLTRPFIEVTAQNSRMRQLSDIQPALQFIHCKVLKVHVCKIHHNNGTCTWKIPTLPMSFQPEQVHV